MFHLKGILVCPLRLHCDTNQNVVSRDNCESATKANLCSELVVRMVLEMHLRFKNMNKNSSITKKHLLWSFPNHGSIPSQQHIHAMDSIILCLSNDKATFGIFLNNCYFNFLCVCEYSIPFFLNLTLFNYFYWLLAIYFFLIIIV